MEVHVRCVGMARLIEKLRDKEEDIADMRNFWRSVGLYLVKRSVSDSFGKEQSPDGTKWASWTQKYKERMEKLGKGGNKILNDHGSHGLLGSIKYVAFKDRVIVGSNLPYAATHQFGDSRPLTIKKVSKNGKPFTQNIKNRNIPPRPYLGVTEQDRTEILRMMRDYFRRHGR